MQGPDLSIVVNGMKFENPFVLGSGPPGAHAHVMAKSFDLGWGGCVIKTISLDASKVINTAPRYAKLRSRETGEVVGFENIELISDRPFEVWLTELRQLKKDYRNKILIASIMEEYRRAAWQRDREPRAGDRHRLGACASQSGLRSAENPPAHWIRYPLLRFNLLTLL